MHRHPLIGPQGGQTSLRLPPSVGPPGARALSPASKRRALVVALGLFLATLAIVAPPVAAVQISQPFFENGSASVTVHFEGPDNVPATRVLLHFSCSESSDFTETLELLNGDLSQPKGAATL